MSNRQKLYDVHALAGYGDRVTRYDRRMATAGELAAKGIRVSDDADGFTFTLNSGEKMHYKRAADSIERYSGNRAALASRIAAQSRYALSESDIERVIEAVLNTEEMQYARQLMEGNVAADSLEDAEPEIEPVKYSREDIAAFQYELQRSGKYLPYDALTREMDRIKYRRPQSPGPTPQERYEAADRKVRDKVFGNPADLPNRVAARAEHYRRKGVYKSYAEIETEIVNPQLARTLNNGR